MAVTKQLYQLQETDAQIEAEEQSLASKNSQLGDRQVLDDAQARLDAAKQHHDEMKRQQHEAEWAVDDVAGKIAAAEEQLYGGKITNPKELSSLQHEVGTFKEKRDQLETEALEIIDRVEAAEESVKSATGELRQLETDWQTRQEQLAVEIKQHESKLADLREIRRQHVDEIEPDAVALYEKIRQQKNPPVARVEQGICRSCRISLSASELQRARSGQPILCGSCGRILFIA